MKHLFTLIVLSASIAIAQAENISTTRDTLFRYQSKVISIKSIGDSLAVQVMPSTAQTDSILNSRLSLPSSITYNGSNYNFAFSWKKKKNMHSHWTGFGMSFMNYDSDDFPLGKLKVSTSHNFSLNLFEYYSPIRNSNWLFVAGVGFDWLRYHFDNNAALTKKDGVALFEPAPAGIDYASSKLLAYYITIPLLLEYQVPLAGNTLHMSAGVVGFLKYYSKSQVKYYIDNQKHVENKGRDLNIRPIDMKCRMQIGIGDISAYGYYSPFSMFDKGEGPDLKTYSIGLQIGF